MAKLPADIDLSLLTEKEREVLGDGSKPHHFPFIVAMFCVALGILGVLMIFQKTGQVSTIVSLKVVGFLVMGIWARNWSRIACFLLLLWHWWLNQQYAGAGSFQLKIVFWAPAISFGLALFFAIGRAALIQKARKS